MTERDWRRSLRGAIYRDDGMAVVAIVRIDGLRDEALQLLGDGLLVAIIGRVEHAVELGTDCVNALRARGWYGDDDLAEQLDAALGRGAIPNAGTPSPKSAGVAGRAPGSQLPATAQRRPPNLGPGREALVRRPPRTISAAAHRQ